MDAEKNSPASAHVAEAIVCTRLIAAPVAEVFSAFSDPNRLAQWWGPKGFANTFHEFDFRPGGIWRFTMRGPDGTAYAMDHRFTEIVSMERIVVRHIQPGHDFTLTITVADRDARTEIVWTMLFDDPAEAVRVRPFVVPANEQNIDRLAAHLSQPVSETGRAVR
jgi:uncharacterized protein YndB with AHSA1/START domain